MTLQETFEDAQTRVNALATAPDTPVLLALYALYKQATEGDATGSRPGMLDLKGRVKYDAWATRKGLSRDAAMEQYVALGDELAKHSRPRHHPSRNGDKGLPSLEEDDLG